MGRRTAAALAPLVIIALFVSSCATIENNPKAVLGTVFGAGAGAGIAALAGGGPGAIVGAGLGGALIGGFIGNRLDARDKRLAAQAAQQAFEKNQAGQPSVWSNPDTGNSGSITPTRTYQLANGQYCREYRQTIVVGGQQEKAYGTACRQPDGTWQIQST
jgi:surface antigen